MANNIVTISVSTQVAPTPSTLQGSGALVTQGGTTTAANTLTLVQDTDDLDAILRVPLAITSITWLANVATVTTTVAHGLPSGQDIPITISGAVPTAYNVSAVGTVTGTSTFTYPLVGDPGTSPAATPGFWTTQAAAELEAMGATFFAQGESVGVYVLELGPDEVAAGVTDLDTWIDDNPGEIYSYLVPEAWADEASFATFVGTFAALTAKTYFFATVDSMNYASFADDKAAFTLAEAPAAPATEFSAASALYRTLSYTPSATTKVPPTAFAYLSGVTAYPTPGNAAQLATYRTAGVNVVGTGAEGGISNKVLFWGTNMDGNDFSYWYAVDWIQINLDQDIANAIINGSNDPTAPLYYNQDGINRLQAVAQATVNRGITNGLLLGPATVEAVPFAEYIADNPSHYADGIYNGLSATVTPIRGFKSITFALVISDFVLA